MLRHLMIHKIWISKILKFDFLEKEKLLKWDKKAYQS